MEALFLIIAFIVGIFYGLNLNIKTYLDEKIHKLPVNIKIQKVEDQYLAYMLHDDQFVLQHSDINVLIEHLEKKYPGRIVVVSRNEL